MASKAALVIVFLTSVSAIPTSYLEGLHERDTSINCASRTCPEDTSTLNFRYEVGRTYRYSYESTVITHVPESHVEERSMLHIAANVNIDVLSSCEMSLRLNDVRMEDVDPRYATRFVPAPRAAEFQRALEKSLLRFSFHNGRIESVCPGGAEETWVLNVKRAIISTFQNNMVNLQSDVMTTETDISGECPVKYEALGKGWSGPYSVRKVKDVEACTSRMNADTIFQATPYHTPSKMQSLPVVRGSHICTQKITTRGILEETRCHESHVFRPFSIGESGATTDVTTKLTYVSDSVGIQGSAGPVTRLPLTFDYRLTSDERRNAREEANELLRGMCDVTTPGIQENAPSTFGRLVHSLRHLDTDDMVHLHNDIRNGRIDCEKSDRFLHDALPNVGTAASAHLIKELILNEEVTDTIKSTWLNSLSFIKAPTPSLISEVTPLLQTSPIDRQAVLSISSLVNNFCRSRATCGEVHEVRTVINILHTALGIDCSSGNVDDHDQVMVALKGLGNTGHAENTVDTLNQCMAREENDMDIRLAAVQALRRMGCTADQTGLRRIFSNPELDSELRINAYLALMSCPSPQILQMITRALEQEEINQVGSFIWTHLTNLQETSNPMKQEIKHILSRETLQKIFDLDKRKFSRNIEKSFFSDMLNSGAVLDSNLIWSGESFVPRSASLNLTFDLFGHSVNLFEVGGRVEGMNHVLQRIFDTNAPPEDDAKKPENVDNIDKQYHPKQEKEPQGSYYMRIFGNEITYEDFHHLDLATLREKLNYLSWLQHLANDHQIEYSKSFHFLDTTVSLPTIAGFPLRLRVEGNAEVQLEVKGSLDVYRLLSDPRNMLIEAKIVPSAAVDITAEMKVDAYKASTGVKTVSTLHTDTEAEGKVELKNGQVFTTDINLPRQTSQIVRARHQLFISHRDVDRPQHQDLPKFEYSRCLNGQFSTITGLEVCTEVSLPVRVASPLSLITSPMSASIVMNKKDTVQKYHFEASIIQTKHSDAAKLILNTPGSEVDRELSVNYLMNRHDKAARINFRSPWKKADFSGSLIQERELIGLTATAVIDEVHTYGTELRLRTEKSGDVIQYNPHFEITVQNLPYINLQGSLFYGKQRNRFEADLELKSPIIDMNLHGFADEVRGSTNVYSSRIGVKYQRPGRKQESLILNNKLRYGISTEKKEFSVLSSMTTTIRPKFNYELDAGFAIGGQTLVSHADVSLAGRQLILLKQSGLLALDGSEKKANLDVHINLPTYPGVNYDVELKNKVTATKVVSSSLLRSSGEEIAKLNIKDEISDTGGTVSAELKYPGRVFNFKKNLQKSPDNNYRLQLHLTSQNGQLFSFLSNMKLDSKYEFSAEFFTAYTGDVKLDGFLEPDLQNPNAQGELVYDNLKYAVAASAQTEGSTRQEPNVKGTIAITYPSRSVGLSANYAYKGKAIQAGCEIQVDGENLFSTEGEAIISLSTPMIGLKVTQMKRFFDINLKGAFHNSWTSATPKVHLSADLNFESSFANTQSVSFITDLQRKTREADFNLQTLLNGTFINYRSCIFNLKYKVANSKLEAATLLQVGRAVIFDTVIEGVKKNFNIEGNATLKTNIFRMRYPEVISLYLSHASNGRKSLSELDIAWAPWNETFNIKMTMDKEISDQMYINRGKLEIRSEKSLSTLNWNHKKKGNTIKTGVDIDLGKTTKLVLDMEGSILKTPTTRGLDIKGSLTDRKYRKKITFKLYHNENILNLRNSKTSFSFDTEDGGGLEIRNDLSFDPSSHLIDTLKVNIGRSFFNLELNNRLLAGQLIANNSLVSGLEGSYREIDTLNGSYTFRSAELNIVAEHSPRFARYRRKFTLRSKPEGTHWLSNVTIEHGAEEKKTFSCEIDTGKQKKIEINLHSPSETFRFDAEHTGDIRNFSSKFFLHSGHLGRMGVEAKSDTRDIKNIDMYAEVVTPIKDAEDTKVYYSHRYTPNEGIVCTAKMQTSYQEIELYNNITMIDFTNFRTKSELSFSDQQKYVVVTSLNKADELQGHIFLQTPFKWTENVKMSLTHHGHLFDSETRIDLVHDRVNTISFYNKYFHARDIHFTSRLTTPYEGYKMMVADFNFEGYMDDYRQDWTFIWEGRKLAGQNIFYWKGERLEYTSSMQTPFPKSKNLLFTFLHLGPLLNFKQDGAFQYPAGKISYENVFNNVDNNFISHIDISTPFKWLRKLSCEINHKGDLSNMENNAIFRYDSYIYDIGSNLKVQTGSFNVEAFFKTPVEYRVRMDHHGYLDDFGNSASAVLGQNVYTIGSKFKAADGKYEGKLYIKAPTEYSISVKHQGELFDYSNEADLKYGLIISRITSEAHIDGGNIKLHAMADSPIIEFVFDLDHQVFPSSFSNGLHIQLNENELKVKTLFQNADDSMIAKSEIETRRHKGLFKMSHKGRRTSFVNSLMIELDDYKLEGASKVSVDELTVEGSLLITAPQKRILLEGFHQGGLENFRCEYNIDVLGHTVFIKNAFIISGHLQANSTIKTNFEAVKSIDISFKHTGHRFDFSNNATVWVDGQLYEGRSKFYRHGNKLSGNAGVRIGSIYSLEFDHERNISDIRSDAKLIWNNSMSSASFNAATTPTSFRVKAVLNLPQEYSVTIVEHVEHAPTLEYTSTINVKLDTDEIIAENRFEMTKGFHVTATSKLKTTYDVVREASLEVKHYQTEGEVQSQALIKMNNDLFFKGAGSFAWKGSIAANADIQIPGHTFVTKASHKGEWNDFRNSLTVLIDGHEYSGSSDFKFSNTLIRMKATVKLPDEYSIMFKHKGHVSDFGNSFQIMMDNTKYNINSAFSSQNGTIDATVNIITPFTNFLKQSFKFSHEGTFGDMKTTCTIETSYPGYEGFGIDMVQRGSIDELKASANIYTPFSALKTAAIIFNQNFSPESVQQNFAINHNRDSIIGVVTYQKSGDSLQLTSALQTTFDQFEKFDLDLKHSGPLDNFKSTVGIKSTIDAVPNIEVNIHHTQLPNKMDSGFLFTDGYKIVSGSFKFENDDAIKLVANLQTPQSMLGKVGISFALWEDGNGLSTTLRIDTPFDTLPTAGFTSTFKKTETNIDASLNIDFVKSVDIDFSHQIHGTDITDSATLIVDNTKFKLLNTFQKMINGDIIESGTFETTYARYKRFTFTLSKKQTEDTLDFFTEFGHPWQRYENPALKVEIKKSDSKIGRSFNAAVVLNTPIHSFTVTTANLSYNLTAKHAIIRASLDINGKRTLVKFESSRSTGGIVSNPSLLFPYVPFSPEWAYQEEGVIETEVAMETPFTGFEKFSLSTRIERGAIKDVYRGEIGLPFQNYNNPSFYLELETDDGIQGTGTLTTPFKSTGTIMAELDFKGNRSNFEFSGGLENNGRYVRLLTRTIKNSKRFDISGKIETSFEGFDILGFELKTVTKTDNLNAIVTLDIQLPRILETVDPSVEITYGGTVSDLKLGWKIILPYMKKLSGSIANQITLEKFATGVDFGYGERTYQLRGKYVKDEHQKKITVLFTTPLKDQYDFEGFYSVTSEEVIINTKLKTPFDEYEDPGLTFTYQGPINNIKSTLEIVTPFNYMQPIVAKLDHRGDLADFVTNLMVQYEGQTITFNTGFEKIENNMKIAAEVHTPFQSYEHFGFSLSHNENGRITRTTGELTMPFSDYANPGFDLEYQSSGQNFEGKLTITTPFTSLEPVRLELMHSGGLSDFQSEFLVVYKRRDFGGKIVFHKRSDNELMFMGDLQTRFSGAERFALTIDYSHSGNSIETKWKIDTPNENVRTLVFELDLSGSLDNFKTTGKIQLPVNALSDVKFEVRHRGITTEFNSIGFVEINGHKFDGHMQYRKKAVSGSPKIHDFFGKIGTPFAFLEQVVTTLSLKHNDDQLTGDIKGSFNRVNFDGDFEIFYSDEPRLVIQVKQPKQMEVELSLNKEQKVLMSKINWDKTSPVCNMKMEVTWKENVNLTTKDREITIVFEKQSQLLHLDLGYLKTEHRFLTKSEVLWKGHSVFFSELELTQASRGQQDLYDGRLRGSTFEVTMNHVVKPGQRYVTQIDIDTREKLTINSDIRVRYPRSKATITIQHPDLSENVIIDLDGAVGTNKISYAGRMDLTYGTQTVEMAGRIADESDSEKSVVTAEASVKHPQSYLDVKLKTKGESGRDMLAGNVEMKYLMARDKEMKTIALKTRINRMENMVVQILTPVKSVNLNARLEESVSAVRRFNLDGDFDGVPFKGDVQFDSSNPSVDIQLEYTPGSTYNVRAGYKHLRHVRAHSYWTRSGQNLVDASFDITVQGNHLIKGEAYIRPSLLWYLTRVYDWRTQEPTQCCLNAEILESFYDELGLRENYFLEFMGPLEHALRVMYSHNDYHLKDVTEGVSKFARSTREVVAPVLHSIYMEAKVLTNKLRVMSRAMVAQTKDGLIGFHTRVPLDTTRLIRNIHGSLLDLANSIRKHPSTQKMLSFTERGLNRVASFGLSSLDQLVSSFTDILENPYLYPVKSWLNTGVSQMISSYTILHMEHKVREFLVEVQSTGLASLRKTTWLIFQDYLRPDLTRINVWAPEEGRVSAQVYVPLILADLQTLPPLTSYVKSMGDFIHKVNYLTNEDDVYGAIPFTNIRKWIPPFKAHATFTGNHYMTFDKKFFGFAGECSYLLTRDFVGGTFSVIVNYEMNDVRPAKKSITVIHSDQEIEILQDFRINVNGKRSELPMFTDYVKVYRIGNNIHIDNIHGANVTCTAPNDICSISVSGWYFGKLAGLLGTFDNEPSTDFTMSNGQRTVSVSELANSWTVGPKCTVKKYALPSAESLTSASDRVMCGKFFMNENSPMRRCFKSVNPETFMTMCMREDACKVAALYVHECGFDGLKLDIPRECMSCDLPKGGSIPGGHQAIIRGRRIPRTADVIILLSHGSCNNDVIRKLSPLIKTIEDIFKQSQRYVRFGLIGYGGTGSRSRPHLHTLDGLLINTRNNLVNSLKHFEIEGGNNEADDLEALEFAARFPFRPGASKIIIMVPCGGCGREDDRYGEIQTSLLHSNTRLHMMVERDFHFKHKTKYPKSSNILGIDRDSAFTTKLAGLRNLEGDSDLRRHIKAPKDLCTALATDTDGTVFNVNKLTQVRDINQKKFQDIFGRVVYKKSQQIRCQVCECHDGQANCHSCQSPAA